MKAKDVYPFVIDNLKRFFANSDPNKEELPFNAFQASSVIAIAFCKTPDDVMNDLLTK